MRNLQQEYLEFLGQQMKQSIDFDIVCDILTSGGWTRFEIEYGGNQPWVAVKEWAAQNFQGDHKEHAGVWLIENSKDATMFALRWRCE